MGNEVLEASLSSFALLGRHPQCGCPMAIDPNASAQGQKEMLEAGLMLEFCPAERALEAWRSATWPCPHSGNREAEPSLSKKADKTTIMKLEVIDPPEGAGYPSTQKLESSSGDWDDSPPSAA